MLIRDGDDSLDGAGPAPDGTPALPIPVSPVDIAAELSRRFPFDMATGQYFTLIYGLLDVTTGRFDYVSAGHPGLAYVPAGGPPQIIDVPGFPIGLAPHGYDPHLIELGPGDRLYLYSDGVPEAMNSAAAFFGTGRMLSGLERGRLATLEQSVSGLIDEVRSWCGSAGLRDDISLLAVEFSPAPVSAPAGGDDHRGARAAGAT
jgi:sigma-B regulation protein RsbU (phosphoserine phosphatase)